MFVTWRVTDSNICMKGVMYSIRSYWSLQEVFGHIVSMKGCCIFCYFDNVEDGACLRKGLRKRLILTYFLGSFKLYMPLYLVYVARKKSWTKLRYLPSVQCSMWGVLGESIGVLDNLATQRTICLVHKICSKGYFKISNVDIYMYIFVTISLGHWMFVQLELKKNRI